MASMHASWALIALSPMERAAWGWGDGAGYFGAQLRVKRRAGAITSIIWDMVPPATMVRYPHGKLELHP